MLSFLSFRNVNDQVSHPYKTTGKIMFVQLVYLLARLLVRVCGRIHYRVVCDDGWRLIIWANASLNYVT